VRWAITSWDDGTGQRVFSAPVDVAVRWEDKAESYTDRTGQQLISDAIVYAQTSFAVGDYLWRGESNQVSSADTLRPENVDGAYEVRSIESVTNLRGSVTLYTAMLRRA
jgi:hypothetical protein